MAVKTVQTESFQNPRTKSPVKPVIFGTRLHGKHDTRAELADWLLTDGRMMLARNIVNRYWARFMGRPLTAWVDDVTPSSVARHPGLLDALARELVEQKFDTKHLIRMICQSRAYQLSSTPYAKPVDRWFGSRFTPRRLASREIFDAIQFVADSNKGTFKDQRVGIPDTFSGLQPDLKENNVECSRNQYRTRIYSYSSSLHLLSSKELTEAIHDPEGIVARLIASDATIEEITQRLFFRILHRKPTAAELESLDKHFKKAERDQYVGDIFWALVNSQELVYVQ